MCTVYLHGLGQTPASWEAVIARLESAGRSECLDLTRLCRGEQAAYKSLYEGLSAICSEIDEPIDLCGLSLGAVLALQYTAEHSEKVNSLVLIAAQYKMPKGLLKLQNVLFRFMPESMFWQTGFGKREFIQLCESMMELDFGDLIQNISCPAFIVCGERDHANKKAAVRLADLLQNAELKILSGVGHEVNTEAPERLAEALRVFYGRVQ